jgi:hypothetical protein
VSDIMIQMLKNENRPRKLPEKERLHDRFHPTILPNLLQKSTKKIISTKKNLMKA